jgi:anthranilate phosphoribosyltransferase
VTLPTGTQSWPAVLARLVAREDLSRDDAAWAMGEILRGEASAAQIAGFVVALRAKGETVDEIDGFVDTMYAHATPLAVAGPALDVVGTGGDRAQTVNISTMAAVVAAAAGARVVKHGNRAASSACGSADLLEELGVRLDLPADRVAALVDAVGITFCFAPAFHPALRHAGPVRRELGIPTTFNFLGPLANPGRPAAMAVGVADVRMAPLVAGVLGRRGVTALVFHGDDGLDELTTTTTSHVWAVHGGAVTEELLDPAALGVPAAAADALRGGDAPANADVARRVLAGERGPVRDAVLLNAGAALAAHAAATGSGRGPTTGWAPGSLAERVAAGMSAAAAAVDSGAAEAVLRRWVAAAGQPA